MCVCMHVCGLRPTAPPVGEGWLVGEGWAHGGEGWNEGWGEGWGEGEALGWVKGARARGGVRVKGARARGGVRVKGARARACASAQ